MDVEEEQTLLQSYSSPVDARERLQNERKTRMLRGAAVTLFLAATLIGFVAFSSSWSQSPSLSVSPVHEELDVTFSPGVNNDGWYIYKAAFAAPNESMAEIVTFLADHSGGTSCVNVDLGCSGYKLSCTFGEKSASPDKQLHYVVAPRLLSSAVDGDNLGVDGWTKKIMESYGEMSSFSAFMHDKTQIFVNDIVAKHTSLKSAGYPLMQRSSAMSDGTVIGHVLVPVGGKIWDFVGALPSQDAAEKKGFKAWAPQECPAAHRIKADLPLLRDSHNASWLSLSTGTSDITSDVVDMLFTQLVSVTGAIIEKEENDYCNVVSFHYYDKWEVEKGGNVGEQVYYRVVENKAYQTTKSGLSLSMYEDYISRVHERFLMRPDQSSEGVASQSTRWRMWDHWLDTHIGIKYSGDAFASSYDDTAKSDLQDTCLDEAKEVNSMLLDNKIPVGKRFIQEDGDHYYSGYSGLTMAIEFNTECHYGDDGATDVCTCVSQNSDTYAVEHDTYKTCGEIYELEDGHNSLTGPWSSNSLGPSDDEQENDVNNGGGAPQ